MSDRERFLGCFHEAGHAVIARKMQIGGLVTATTATCVFNGSHLSPVQKALIYAAGCAAELIADQFEAPDVVPLLLPPKFTVPTPSGVSSIGEIDNREGAATDVKHIMRCARETHPDDLDAALKMFYATQEEAAVLVERYADEIFKVACVIYECGFAVLPDNGQ